MFTSTTAPVDPAVKLKVDPGATIVESLVPSSISISTLRIASDLESRLIVPPSKTVCFMKRSKNKPA